MVFCCLRRNVETSCHKHSVVVSRHQQIPPFTACTTCRTVVRWRPVDNIWPVASLTDIGSESRFLTTPPAFGAPVKGVGRFPSEHCHAVWYGKTRMAWLPDGEKSLRMRSLVLAKFANVTDRRTDTAWPQVSGVMRCLILHVLLLLLQAVRTGSGSRVLVRTAASATLTVDVYVALATAELGVNSECTSLSCNRQVNYHHHHHHHHR